MKKYHYNYYITRVDAWTYEHEQHAHHKYIIQHNHLHLTKENKLDKYPSFRQKQNTEWQATVKFN